MEQKEIEWKGRQAGGLLAGLGAPGVVLAARCSPGDAALGAAVAGLFGAALYTIYNKWSPGRWTAAAMGAAFLALAGTVARRSGACFPQWEQEPWIPVTLLALAAWTLRDGGARARGCGGALWLAAPMSMAVLLGSAAGDGLGPLEPGPGRVGWTQLAALLAPGYAAAFALPMKKREAAKALRLGWAAGALCVFSALAARAVLGTALQNTLEAPFDALMRAGRVLGIAERFEAGAAAVLTADLFLGLCLYGAAADRMLRRAGMKNGAAICFFFGAGAIALAQTGVSKMTGEMTTAIFCGLMFVYLLNVVLRKKV